MSVLLGLTAVAVLATLFFCCMEPGDDAVRADLRGPVRVRVDRYSPVPSSDDEVVVFSPHKRGGSLSRSASPASDGSSSDGFHYV